jgi:hypothetical protein
MSRPFDLTVRCANHDVAEVSGKVSTSHDAATRNQHRAYQLESHGPGEGSFMVLGRGFQRCIDSTCEGVRLMVRLIVRGLQVCYTLQKENS